MYETTRHGGDLDNSPIDEFERELAARSKAGWSLVSYTSVPEPHKPRPSPTAARSSVIPIRVCVHSHYVHATWTRTAPATYDDVKRRLRDEHLALQTGVGA